MAETSPINSISLSRQSREKALHQAEENYKNAPKPMVNNKEAKISPEPGKVDEPALAISRTGMIKLIIIHNDADSDHMVDFENSLRKIPDIHLVMVGGTTRGGVQIIVSSEKSIVLSHILTQPPTVEEITNHPQISLSS